LEHAQTRVATSAEVNPTLDAAFLAAEERRDPDGYRGEYLAALVGSGGAFIDAELVADAVAGRGELDPGDADGYVAGIDPSFTKDPFGLAIVGRDRANRDRLLLALARSWPPPKGRAKGLRGDRHQLEDRILNEACDVLERFRVKTVVTDNYMAQTVHEALRRRGFIVESLVLTTGTKLEMFSGLKARLTSGTLELYDQPTMLAELRRLRSSFRGGARQVETPRLQGTHCDLAIALGLAVHELDRHGPAGRGMPRVDERDRGEPRASLTHDLFSRVF
jgi:phage terminase large subunit-like protein